MGSHENYSTQSEWYTPKYIFDALGCRFDLDVAAAPDPSLTHVPADVFYSSGSLEKEWSGFVWCNPPWAGRGNKDPWVNKIASHANGLLLTPDRSSAPWWGVAASRSSAVLFLFKKIKFIPGPGNLSNNKQPGSGTTIFALGPKGIAALENARNNKLGLLMSPAKVNPL